MTNSISIKGTREGLTIGVGEADVAKILDGIQEHLQGHGAFFRGGRVALEVGSRPMDEDDLSAIVELLESHQMVLRTIVSDNPITQRACQELGLRLLSSEKPAPAPSVRERSARRRTATVSKDMTNADKAVALFVRHRVRSGQVLRHTGNVTILGDVNPGAEVVAGGDIVIWGRLRGTVHAGYTSNLSAVVCALDFAPVQVRIANLVSRPEMKDSVQRGPEVACVSDNDIIVRPWDDSYGRQD